VRQLELMRQCYRVFPITNALRLQLNWAQYKLLIRIKDEDKRELEGQINSSLFKSLSARFYFMRILFNGALENAPYGFFKLEFYNLLCQNGIGKLVKVKIYSIKNKLLC
jgi:hypothetical protein